MLTSTEKRNLTARQQEILDFIKAQPYPPSVREIAEHFGLTSTNGIACHLRAIEGKGAIKRTRGKARSIVLVEKITPTPIWCSMPFGGMVR